LQTLPYCGPATQPGEPASGGTGKCRKSPTEDFLLSRTRCFALEGATVGPHWEHWNPLILKRLRPSTAGEPARGGPLAADDLPHWLAVVSGLLLRSLVQVLFEDLATCDI